MAARTGKQAKSREIVRFTWRVDPEGYELTQPSETSKSAQSPMSPTPAGIVRAVRLAGLHAARSTPYSGTVLEDVQGVDRTNGTYIVPRSGRLVPTDFGLRGDKAYIEFLNARDPVDVLKFVNKWGLLYRMSRLSVLDFLKEQARLDAEVARLKKLTEETRPRKLANHFGTRRLATLSVACDERARPEDPSPKSIFSCRNLLDFCWLQLVRDYTRGIDVRCCKGGGEFFLNKTSGKDRPHCGKGACRIRLSRERKRTGGSTAEPPVTKVKQLSS
jgi:hypothetical protein